MNPHEKAFGSALANSENAITWRKLCTLLTIELITLALGFVHAWLVFGDSRWWILAAGAVVAACFALVLKLGPRRIFVTEMTLAVSSTAVLICCLLNSQYKIEAGITTNAFEGFKLFIVAVALLAFRNWKMGATLIGLSTVLPIAQFYSWPPAWRESVGNSASSVLLYAVVGAVCYVYGYRSQQAVHRLLQRDLEASELKRFARAMLSAKDLSNTPLQVLKGSITLLRRDSPALADHFDRMERACVRLEELNGIFSRYEASIDWVAATDLDSAQTLEGVTEAWVTSRSSS